jgi:hypothetical protein
MDQSTSTSAAPSMIMTTSCWRSVWGHKRRCGSPRGATRRANDDARAQGAIARGVARLEGPVEQADEAVEPVEPVDDGVETVNDVVETVDDVVIDVVQARTDGVASVFNAVDRDRGITGALPPRTPFVTQSFERGGNGVTAARSRSELIPSATSARAISTSLHVGHMTPPWAAQRHRHAA